LAVGDPNTSTHCTRVTKQHPYPTCQTVLGRQLKPHSCDLCYCAPCCGHNAATDDIC
jgi:hypothetical protein